MLFGIRKIAPSHTAAKIGLVLRALRPLRVLTLFLGPGQENGDTCQGFVEIMDGSPQGAATCRLLFPRGGLACPTPPDECALLSSSCGGVCLAKASARGTRQPRKTMCFVPTACDAMLGWRFNHLV